jgi:hypothetical protein
MVKYSIKLFLMLLLIKTVKRDSNSFTLINYKPFRSLRSTVKILPISIYKLPLLLDSGILYKGYYSIIFLQFKKLNQNNLLIL